MSVSLHIILSIKSTSGCRLIGGSLFVDLVASADELPINDKEIW